MTDLDRALREVVAELDRMSVPYAVMGGLAVRVYGIPRATGGSSPAASFGCQIQFI